MATDPAEADYVPRNYQEEIADALNRLAEATESIAGELNALHALLESVITEVHRDSYLRVLNFGD